MTRDCTWPGCTKPTYPGFAEFCAAHYQADRHQGTAPRQSRFDEFVWLTEFMHVGWGDAARRVGYNTYEAIAQTARRHGRHDLYQRFHSMALRGERP